MTDSQSPSVQSAINADILKKAVASKKLDEALAQERALEDQLAEAKKAVKKAREEFWALEGVVPG